MRVVYTYYDVSITSPLEVSAVVIAGVCSDSIDVVIIIPAGLPGVEVTVMGSSTWLASPGSATESVIDSQNTILFTDKNPPSEKLSAKNKKHKII